MNDKWELQHFSSEDITEIRVAVGHSGDIGIMLTVGEERSDMLAMSVENAEKLVSDLETAIKAAKELN